MENLTIFAQKLNTTQSEENWSVCNRRRICLTLFHIERNEKWSCWRSLLAYHCSTFSLILYSLLHVCMDMHQIDIQMCLKGKRCKTWNLDISAHWCVCGCMRDILRWYFMYEAVLVFTMSDMMTTASSLILMQRFNQISYNRNGEPCAIEGQQSAVYIPPRGGTHQ